MIGATGQLIMTGLQLWVLAKKLCWKHEACNALFKEIQDYLGSRGVGCNIEEDYKNLDQQIDQENREQGPVLYNLYTPN